jgi:hypothetical protein
MSVEESRLVVDSGPALNAGLRRSLVRPSPSQFDIVGGIQGDMWLDKVRFAFSEADTSETRILNMEQFQLSRLRFLISDATLARDQMEDCFRQIDADSDDQITWNQLVDYLLCIQRSLAGGALEKSLRITFVSPSDSVMRKYQ